MNTRPLGTIDVNKLNFHFETDPREYIKTMVHLLNENDINNLKNRKYYLRFFCKRNPGDSEDDITYIDCYIREIDRMIPSHKEEASILFENIHDSNLVLLEINYTYRGFFHLCDI